MAEWEGAQEALTLVQDRWQLWQRNWMYHMTWYLNLNFYVGNQWLRWEPGLRQIVQPPSDPEKPRVTENRIQPMVRQAVGRVMRQKLRQVSPPDSHDESAADKAKVRSQLLEHLDRETKMDELLKTGLFWAANTGNFFARYCWDPDAGPRKKKGKPLGDIAVVPVSPFSMVFPPNCLTLDEMPWVIEVTTRPVSWVEEQHGVKVDADATPSMWGTFDARVLDFTSSGAWINSQTDVSTKNAKGETVDGGSCRYMMYWERPTAKYEDGRFVIVAGGKVVYPKTEEEAQEGILVHSPSGDLPYNQLKWFDTPFRFLHMGLVEPLVPMQRERNLYASMIAEALRYVARGGWMAPRGSVKKDEWSAEAGSINEYTPVGGFKPDPVTPRAISGEFFVRMDKIDQDMADIAGIHFRPPTGVKAAAAFALQQETDNTLSEPVVDNVKAFLTRDGKLKLQLARKYYDTGRTIRVAGKGHQWEALEFSADDMGDSDAVIVTDAGQLAQDKMQRLEQVLKLLAAKDAKGEPVIDAYEARRLLDLENSENIDSQVHGDMTRARWENSRLEKANDVPVNRWDNHSIHLQEHYTRMKRIDFDELTPAAREAFIRHTLAHEQGKAVNAAPAQGQQVPPHMAPPGGQMPWQGVPGQSAQMAQQMLPEPPSNQVQAGLQAGLTGVQKVVSQANQ